MVGLEVEESVGHEGCTLKPKRYGKVGLQVLKQNILSDGR